MSVEFLKLNSLNRKISDMGESPSQRLIGLSKTLSEWNTSRIGKVKNGKEADLTINNIQTLKKLIENEVKKSKVNNIDVVTDQILFLFIGAIKLQIQNNSDKPWKLVDQSISNFLTYEKQPQKNLLLLSMLTIIVIIGFSFSFLNNHKNKSRIDSNNPLDISTINESGSETVSSLVNLYEAMKSGDCQLPQAAMLQSGEREAFISFVNEGKVDIKTAPRLKNALNYATCLYPQKLMNHPL